MPMAVEAALPGRVEQVLRGLAAEGMNTRGVVASAWDGMGSMGRLKVGKFQTGCMATIGVVFLLGVVLFVYASILGPAEKATTRPEHGCRGGMSSPFAGGAKPRAAAAGSGGLDCDGQAGAGELLFVEFGAFAVGR